MWQGRGGGALCPHYADSGHCTLPQHRAAGPLKGASQSSPVRAVLRLSLHTHRVRAQGEGGSPLLSGRTFPSPESLHFGGFWTMVWSAVEAVLGLGPPPGHLNSKCRDEAGEDYTRRRTRE